jgi:hypothetical protein
MGATPTKELRQYFSKNAIQGIEIIDDNKAATFVAFRLCTAHPRSFATGGRIRCGESQGTSTISLTLRLDAGVQGYRVCRNVSGDLGNGYDYRRLVGALRQLVVESLVPYPSDPVATQVVQSAKNDPHGERKVLEDEKRTKSALAETIVLPGRVDAAAFVQRRDVVPASVQRLLPSPAPNTTSPVSPAAETALLPRYVKSAVVAALQTSQSAQVEAIASFDEITKELDRMSSGAESITSRPHAAATADEDVFGSSTSIDSMLRREARHVRDSDDAQVV